MKILTFVLTFVLAIFICNPISADSSIPDPIQKPDATFRLFRTMNIWTFIKLDTRDGRLWLLTYDIKGDSRGTLMLNDRPLVDPKKSIPGRFTLYPTTNMYNFILLDQIEGRAWQIQWSIDSNNRIILPIPEVSE